MRFAGTYQNAPEIRATYINVIKIGHISTGCIHGYIVKIIGLVLFVYLKVVDIFNISRDLDKIRYKIFPIRPNYLFKWRKHKNWF